jgi:peptidoglycan/xylan/chitin deacetylase (PgdA/CDA1 family)
MAPRWNWDFEDQPRAQRKRSSEGPSAAHPPSRAARIRRRRLAAGTGLLALLIALLAVLLVSSAERSKPVVRARPHAAGASSHRTVPRLDAAEGGEKAIGHVLAYTPFVKAGSERVRDIALTFDDGPGPYTPGVLDVLERERVPATFFVIGEELRYFSASTVREIHDGYVIGDHTETHPMMAELSAHDQHEELFEQAARIELLGGRRPRLFRPPYGSFNSTTFHELHQMHMLMVLWSVDTNDYEMPGVQVIVQNALQGAKPGAIILMHDAGGDRSETIEALPTIIHELRRRGYHLVTVPQLLAADPPPAGQPLPQNLSGD